MPKASWQSGPSGRTAVPDPLLATKLHIPPLRPRGRLVVRPRLLERLDAGLIGRLILVSAPAGFGKTTLLSEWLSVSGDQLAASPVRAAWLSLDSAENDPGRFLHYIVAALQAVVPGAVEATPRLFESPQPAPIDAILTVLVNELDVVPGQVVLVLDDYHLIETIAVHQALAFLLDHLPAQIHLVVSTRADPPLPLPRLRARSQLAEIRAQDLRFTPDEAASFFNQAMGLGVSAEDLARLEERTEGWVAGLQLAALAMEGLLAQGQEALHTFVAGFAGSSRYIVDYLADDVLDRQSPEIQSFLLQTSILHQLNGPLCDAVTGRSDGQATLALLDQANLFVVPLDDSRSWYRYHHLFAEFLRTRVPAPWAQQVALRHSRAAAWYAEQGFTDEAMRHALAGQDFVLAARIVEQAGGLMLNSGDWNRLLGWLDALPGELLATRPALCLLRAWALVLTSRLEAVEPSLRAVEQLSDAEADSDRSVLRGWRGQVTAIRGRIASQQGDIPRAIELSHQALELLPEEDLVIRGIVAMNLGLTCLLIGDLAEARRSLEQGRQWSLASHNQITAQTATAALAQVHQEQGQLRRAAAECRELLARAQGQINRTVVSAHLALASTLYEWNELDEAGQHLEAGMDLAREAGIPGGVVLGTAQTAAVRQAQGLRAEAKDLMLRAQTDAHELQDQALVDYVTILSADLTIAYDETLTVQWTHDLAPVLEDRASEATLLLYKHKILALALAWLANQKPAQAEMLLGQLVPVLRTAGHIASLIEALALQALAWQAQGQSDQALTALQEALALAEPEGYVRTFVDRGELMARLLRQAFERQIASAYVDPLLAAFDTSRFEPVDMGPLAGARPGQKAASVESGAPMIERLNEQEFKILGLVAAGLSNREIARELFLSVNTVKWYLKEIYGKLDAHGRVEAISRARELGLL